MRKNRPASRKRQADKQHTTKAPAGRSSSSGWQLRPHEGQGPYTKYFSTFFPMKVEAAFYEFLRENIPIIDAAINRLVALDGHIVVKGDNEALVSEIQDWIDNVQVNDIETGLQAFHRSLSNETFEQGFGLGEFVVDAKRTDITGLRVADSKFIKFERDKATRELRIKQKVTGDQDWRDLKRETLMYFSINSENQNPQGVPLMRSCEFVSKILKTMQNSLLNCWERFGDPSFSLIYKTSRREGADLASRRKTLEDELNTAVRAKREGKSADFVRAIDTGSDIKIEVIGAQDELLEFEIPSRHVLEQIVAKSGLAPWMLGMHWSTTERLSNAEAELILAEVVNRQASKMPLFVRLIKTLLLLRGRTWKPGDWRLEWVQANLHDIAAQAQARFMNAQADMYYLQNAEKAGITLNLDDLAIGKSVYASSSFGRTRRGGRFTIHGGSIGLCSCSTNHDSRITNHGVSKELSRPSPWPELDRVETQYEALLKERWSDLKKRVLTILQLEGPKAMDSLHIPMFPSSHIRSAASSHLRSLISTSTSKGPEDAFAFSEADRARIMAELKNWIGEFSLSGDDSAVRFYYGQAYSLGLIQAAKLIGKERPLLDILKNQEIYDELCKTGFGLLKDSATKAIIQNILPEMEGQMLAGTNPRHVADRLERLFGEQNSDWERLARTEMSMAAETAKLDEWGEWGVREVEFTPAPDACPICFAVAGEYPVDECPIPGADTHPRCRCSIRVGKGERV